MATGTVKFYNDEKGYGFITAEDGRNSDLFFHISSCDNATLRIGQRVRFEERVSKRNQKPEAYDVELI